MSELREIMDEQQKPPSSTRLYIIIAAVLVVVIVVIAILLITVGLPALRKGQEPTPVAVQPTATPVPTFTPGPTKMPTNTPLPEPTATPSDPYMSDTDNPIYQFESAGARPGADWTGFFGHVVDAQGTPLPSVPLIVWYRDGQPGSPIVKTDESGYYEIRLAEAPLAGTWSIQVLTDDNLPASKLFTFQTDEDTKAGIQQIQVIWKQIP